MGSAGVKAVSIQEYLSNPAYKHCEYVDGQVVELNIGTGRHGSLRVEYGARLLRYLGQNPVGHAYIKLHCKLRIGGQLRYRLPDVCVSLGPFVEGHLEGAPDLCVEIRSPEDSVSGQIGEFEDYFASGCKIGWLILPEEGTVLVLKPGT